MPREIRISFILSVVGVVFLCLTFPSMAEESKGGTASVFQFEPMIIGSAVSGHDDKFRELFQMPDGVSGGVGSLSFDQQRPNGDEIHLDGDLQSGTDYKCALQYQHKDLWTLNVGFRDFVIYSNNASPYYTMAPGLSVLNDDLDVDRRDISFKFSLHPEKLPHFSFGYERKNKLGDQLLSRRGQLASFMDYNLPLSSETYNKSDVYTFNLGHNLVGTNLSLTQTLERFNSRIGTDQIQFNNGLGLYTRLSQQDQPEYRNATTNFTVDRTFRKNLFLVGQYWYRDLKSNSDYSQLIFDPATGRLQGYYGTPDTDSDAKLTSHNVLLNLSYLFRNFLSFYGGVRYVDADKDASSLTTRRDVLGMVDLVQNGMGDANEQKWSGVTGFKLTFIPRTTLDYEARLDRSSVDFRQSLQSSRGFIDNFLYNTDAQFDTTSHVVRLSVKPCRSFFILGQYRYSKFDTDYDDVVTSGLGGYPNFLGDWDNETNDFWVKTMITLCRPLKLSFKYQDKSVDYDVSPAHVSRVAQTDLTNYNAALTYTPLGNLFLSFMFNHQDLDAQTRAAWNPRNIPYDLNVDSFLSTVNLLWNEKLSFSGSFNYADGDGSTQNLGGDGSLGSMPYGYTLQTYSLGVNYRKSPRLSWQIRYMYANYDENDNGGINNFHANIISGRLYLTF